MGVHGVELPTRASRKCGRKFASFTMACNQGEAGSASLDCYSVKLQGKNLRKLRKKAGIFGR
jgi:hypothetical protein